MAFQALDGEEWSSQLEYVHYEGEKVSFSAKYEHCHLPDGLAHPPGAKGAIDGKVNTLTAFKVDLKISRFSMDRFKKMMTHHFIQAETDNGYLFTLEKNTKCISVQSCRLLKTESPAVVLVRIQGEKRHQKKTREVIKIDTKPKQLSIGDIVRWIHETGQLEKTYRVGEANCQHFAGSLWYRFSSVEYPIPADYEAAALSPPVQATPLSEKSSPSEADIPEKGFFC